MNHPRLTVTTVTLGPEEWRRIRTGRQTTLISHDPGIHADVLRAVTPDRPWAAAGYAWIERTRLLACDRGGRRTRLVRSDTDRADGDETIHAVILFEATLGPVADSLDELIRTLHDTDGTGNPR